MQDYLPGYRIDPTTWAYVSSLLTIGIFFKFHRLWSVRNLDLIGLIALAPGLLWIAEHHGPGGYVWLFAIGGLFLVRLLLDPLMVRRPLLEPNLNASGLTFTGIALLVFLMSNVLAGRTTPLATQPLGSSRKAQVSTYPLFYVIADLSSDEAVAADDQSPPEQFRREWVRVAVIRTMAVAAHLAVVIGIVLIGYRHFQNFHAGVAMASLYLLLPYTAQMTPRIDHVVPAALLVWAVQAYRRPGTSGTLVGLAMGLIGYPLFLLPLWCSFYWRRGLLRFLTGVVLGLVLLIALLLMLVPASQLFGAGDVGSFGERLQQLFGWASPTLSDADGFWQHRAKAYRIPVVAAFWVLCGSMALWPAQKNLGTLLCCSAAVMLGVQFFHPHQGGVYMAWYLPLLVMTIFRPNLEDRVAITAVTEGWLPSYTTGRVPWRIEDWLPWRKKGWAAGQKERGRARRRRR